MSEMSSLGSAETAPGDSYSFEVEATALLLALEHHDAATRNHSDSVASWSRRIAEVLGLPLSARCFIERCALLHDIGKIFTPKEFLTNPGPLTVDEWVRMKAHAAEGAAMLAAVPRLADYADVVRAHHEHYDGRGYPHGLRGDAIRCEARIISVADAFDAMISRRDYRKSLSVNAAITEVQRCRGSQFEPAVADALVSLLLPEGARLRRSSADTHLHSRYA